MAVKGFSLFYECAARWSHIIVPRTKRCSTEDTAEMNRVGAIAKKEFPQYHFLSCVDDILILTLHKK